MCMYIMSKFSCKQYNIIQSRSPVEHALKYMYSHFVFGLFFTRAGGLTTGQLGGIIAGSTISIFLLTTISTFILIFMCKKCLAACRSRVNVEALDDHATMDNMSIKSEC